MERSIAISTPTRRVASGCIRRSSRRRPATGRGSTTTATARRRSTSCPAPPTTRGARPGVEQTFDGGGRRLHLHPGRRDPRRGERLGDRAAGRRADPQLPRFARRLPRRRARRRATTSRRRAEGLSRRGRSGSSSSEHGLAGVPEAAVPERRLVGRDADRARSRRRDRFVLKRTSPAADWIVRATRDIGAARGRSSPAAGSAPRRAARRAVPRRRQRRRRRSRSSCPTCRTS